MPTAGHPANSTDRIASSPFFVPEGSGPLRGEIFGQAYLEDYARLLARASVASLTGPTRSIYDRLRDDERLLRDAHATIRAASNVQETLTTDAEWLLDNFFIVEDVLREVTRDLPASYYSELPRLTEGAMAGFPRILALAVGLVAHSDSSLSENQIRDFVRAYQAERQLTIGELWAIPTMLRLALVENLRRLSQQMIETREDREYAGRWVAAQGQEARGKRAIRPPERKSDAALVAIVQALRDQGVSAQPIVNWLDDWLEKENLSAADLLRRENRRQAVNQVSVGNCITSLRLLNALDWATFVEQTSLVESTLRGDPTRVYAAQDFPTRDRCRQTVERIARRSQCTESEVAQKALNLAAAASDERRKQVAYYLLDRGRAELERACGYRPTLADRRRNFLRNRPTLAYFGLLLFVLVAILAKMTLLTRAGRGDIVTVLLVAFLPASELAVGVVNFLITRLLPPTTLPKLDAKDGIPEGCGAFVVMPSMLTKAESGPQLLERLELHYLANPDPQLRFALLTDFADAATETLPTDQALVDAAIQGAEHLNRKYGATAQPLFFVFHRKRLWNPSEGKWMGWERKRGKLLEFNRLLRGATDTSYVWKSGKIAQPEMYRYVITLDTDTNLPRETARRMICTLAHPLNRAVPDATHTKVSAGYAILQPRMSFLFQTGSRSRFAKTLASSAGIDPYQAAVSDVYMDLFDRGSFIGKGIYDVDAFEAVTGPAFPENRILSHDLIESNYARCALATDVELLDEFPARYHAYARREHRWVRGDWQLLPWLMPRVPCNVRGQEGRRPNTLDTIERWKVLDNLRRSLVGPAVVLMVALGWTVLPGSPWVWTLFAFLVAAWPLVIFLLNSGWSVLSGSAGGAIRAARGSLPGTAMQSLFSVGFLLDQSRLALHAIGVTLTRLFLTRRHFLEWETAAATEQRLGEDLFSFVRTMGLTSLIAAGLTALVAAVKPGALWAALPLLSLWFLSPVLAWWVSQPIPVKVVELTETDRRALRRIARKTWGFFETFVGPEDNWLPPDNYQEDPKGEIAHRTSPTNKGLLVLSTLAAHDFGYLSLGKCVERLGHTFDTFDKLEKFRGHILNWYDTRTLVPLHPPYISVVDSGNMMGCLIALRHGLLEKLDEPIPSPQSLDGLTDTLNLAEECLDAAKLSLADREPLGSRLRAIRGKIAAPPTDLPGWYKWVQSVLEETRPITDLAAKHANKTADGQLQRWTDLLREQVYDLAAELQAVCPWAGDVADFALAPVAGPLAELRDRLVIDLSAVTSLAKWSSRIPTLRVELEKLGDRGGKVGARLRAAIEQSTAPALAKSVRRLANRCQTLADGMDFRFLYNPDRHLFSIGFNKAVGRLDNAHYDLLASECRLTSFLAVARGEVPRKHWLMLGRPVTMAAGKQGLLSWGGTMFEYLMPRLLLPTYSGTLLDLAERTAVARQQEFGYKTGVPWGVSESGFSVLDAWQTYQYQSFGVPGLGLKRGLQNDVVIAPYASLMAVVIDPHAVRINLDELAKLGGEGPYGVYEALDFTRRRVPTEKKCIVVKQYMAHHQGMGFIALANRLLGDLMPRRFRAEPMVRANELLLQEKVPVDAPIVVPPEDDESTRKVALSMQMPFSRKLTTADTPSPRTHLLSNGQYTIVVTNAGGGYSSCRGLDVTRYREDRTRDLGGLALYVRNTATGQYWSAAHHPCGGLAEKYEVTFSIDKVDFRRLDGDIETHTEITVSPEKNVEVRRVTVTNHGTKPVDLDVTSYCEIALAARAADLAHPAFQKLFLETEWVPAQRALLCRRRPRSAGQNPVWAVHTVATEGRAVAPPTFETDRARFLGRRRTAMRPQAMEPGAELSGTTGPVLDPVFALRQKVHVEPGASASVAFALAVADTRVEALSLADQYNAFHAVLRVFDVAWAQSRVELRDLHVTVEDSHLYQRLAGFLQFPAPHLRATAEQIRANRQPQSGLWKFGVSGDLPILLVRVKDGDGLGLLRQITSAQAFWRINGFVCDVVVLNEHAEGYLEGFHEQILNSVKAGDANALFDRPGGVFVRKADQMSAEDRALLLACARVILIGERGPLADQLDLPEKIPTDPPALVAQPSPGDAPLPLATRDDLMLTNGFGGFTQDGHEYVITFDPATGGTPMPWCNVIANEGFGFLVSEAGGSCTWAGNSQMNRLTPWANDPVSDSPSEAVYLRDEESGEIWSVTALPVAGDSPVRCRHGQGYSAFERNHAGLEHELRLTVAPSDPVKIIRLKVINHSGRPRRLAASYFAELVLGTTREVNALHVVTEIDAESGALFARNAYHPDYGGHVAFLDVSHRPRSITGDRTEFLGRNGAASDPAALHRTELSNRTGAGFDPCAAVMAKFDLGPGETAEVVFVFGQAADDATARRLASSYRDPTTAELAFRQTVAQWDQYLNAIEVRTPDSALNHLVNRWLPYQVLACRFWGRTAMYQSGGAYGYRDQLQDSLALTYGKSLLTRQHILRAASRQFREGDTQHWWHPPGGAGVRTRCSDDYLFLPYCTAFYCEKTGDAGILDEQVPFITGPVLAEGQDEDYNVPGVSEDTASLYEHCIRALDRAGARGVHGLPLMGNGDWNDGMNQVGHGGQGESVWLGWFLADVYRKFAPICEARGETVRAREYLSKADELIQAIDQHAWDGQWYRRAWFDDGTPLGSASNDECQIDVLPQAWASITGGGDPERAERALVAMEERLVRRDDRLILLFCPPFDQGKLQPGYIKGYVPGIRENGGQYTHGATWAVLAAAKLGRGQDTKELVDLLNPARLTESPDRVARYKVEPYVIAADVYGRAPHIGRGGWTWYTGSASWYWRIIVESMLGFELLGQRFTLKPCIPPDWTSYQVTYRRGKTTYRIQIENPNRLERGSIAITLDGTALADGFVPLADDGKEHVVVATLR